ncbi:hypothetical protein AB0D85_40755, partial [Streptomyces sp. NPDC048277]
MEQPRIRLGSSGHSEVTARRFAPHTAIRSPSRPVRSRQSSKLRSSSCAEDSNGQPVAVTGAYIEPTAAWQGDGPRPLVAL